MFTFKLVKSQELESVLRNASNRLGVSERILEKDYWVCFILNYLFSYSKWKESFSFKGGTSLSKCYQLIERFSEDIDLILDWRVLGYEKDEPWNERSNRKQQQFGAELNQRTAIFIAEKLLPQMRADFSNILEEPVKIEIDIQNPQTILFEYASKYQIDYVKPVVRIEIGALAAWTPSERLDVVPEIWKVYPQLFIGQGISVRAVLPERTFWEKLTILHHEAHRPKNSKIPLRYARHYYDVYCIARTKYKKSSLEQMELLKKVVDFKEKFYPRKWAHYEEATLGKIRLLPDSYRLSELKSDYDRMEEMFFREAPAFETMMATIETLEMEIHLLKEKN